MPDTIMIPEDMQKDIKNSSSKISKPMLTFKTKYNMAFANATPIPDPNPLPNRDAEI